MPRSTARWVCVDLIAGVWQILATLVRGRSTQHGVAAALSRLDNDAKIAAIVADLIERRMVRRGGDDQLEITDRGTQALEQAAREVDVIRARVGTALGHDGYEQLIGLLIRLVERSRTALRITARSFMSKLCSPAFPWSRTPVVVADARRLSRSCVQASRTLALDFGPCGACPWCQGIAEAGALATVEPWSSQVSI